MKNAQRGFSIIEGMVSMLVLSITAFGFLGSTVVSMSMKRTGMERSSAARAADSAMESLFYNKGNRDGLVLAMSNFPKQITSQGTSKAYTVSLLSMHDHVGNAADINALPAHGVIVVTLSVPYSENRSVGAASTKTITPSYVMEF